MEILSLYKVLKTIFFLGSLIAFQSFATILDKRLQLQNNIGQLVEIPDFESDENFTETNSIPTNPTRSVPLPLLRNNNDKYKPVNKCNLNRSIIDEIQSYQPVANRIFKTILSGSFKGRTYNDLAYFVDRFGSRLAGSENLENAIDYMLDKLVQDWYLENVHGENVTIPHWVRGDESAYLISPRRKKLALLGLGYSIGTPANGITAEVLVVTSFEDLRSKANQAKGKIVVYNEEYISYGETVKYRGQGAVEAAKYGAVASLIRSITDYSINTPHTGMQSYKENVTKIPTACIALEDAEMLHRMQLRGDKLIIQLKMLDYNLPMTTSRNVIAEVIGREKPDEVVVVSGHMDSWDVGQGAMDDGGGMFISAEAVALVKFLGLKPRRTLRAILWTTEEFGLIGVQEYVKRHDAEMDKFVTVFESDIGTFRPLGLDFSGTDEAGCILQEVLKLMTPINATKYRKQAEVGSDIGYFIQKGVPGVSLNTENSQYFAFHHSEGDTMTVENSDELDLCTAVWTTASYVLADLSITLPR